MTGFFVDLAALPPRHPRRIGLWLMRLGIGALLPSICFGLAVMHIAFTVAAAGVLLARPPLHRLPGFWFGAAFAAWQGLSIASTFVNGNPHPIGYGMVYLWSCVYVAQIAFADALVRRRAVQLLLVTVSCSSLLAIAQFVVGLGGKNIWHIDPNGERFSHSVGFAPIHLTQGYIMSLVLLVLGAAPLLAGPLDRIGLWVARGYALVALIISSARLAYVGLPLAVGAGLATGGRKRLIWSAAIVIGGLAAAAGAVAILSPDRFQNMLHWRDGRFAIWRASTEIVARHPLLGTGGAEAFKAEYRAVYPQVVPEIANEFPKGAPHAHNSILSIAAMHGIPAAVFYLCWIGALMLGEFRRRHGNPEGWALAVSLMVAALVAGLFEDLVGHSAPAFATFVTLGLAFGLNEERRSAAARVSQASEPHKPDAA